MLFGMTNFIYAVYRLLNAINPLLSMMLGKNSQVKQNCQQLTKLCPKEMIS